MINSNNLTIQELAELDKFKTMFFDNLKTHHLQKRLYETLQDNGINPLKDIVTNDQITDAYNYIGKMYDNNYLNNYLLTAREMEELTTPIDD